MVLVHVDVYSGIQLPIMFFVQPAFGGPAIVVSVLSSACRAIPALQKVAVGPTGVLHSFPTSVPCTAVVSRYIHVLPQSSEGLVCPDPINFYFCLRVCLFQFDKKKILWLC
jgi:hypothetical protein